jgi:hypothetical protein
MFPAIGWLTEDYESSPPAVNGKPSASIAEARRGEVSGWSASAR